MDYIIFGISWQEFVEWFLDLPFFGQVLVIAGIIAILAVAITLVYYILKGLGYLLYYTAKGLFSLFKWIILGIVKIFGLIFGKSKPENNVKNAGVEKSQEKDELITIPTEKFPKEFIQYCPECGSHITPSMVQRLNLEGSVYCVFCGKSIEENTLMVES